MPKARSEQWLRENRAAIDSSNEYVERHGLPLDELRQF
ncbi:MAG: type II toxin-antitoxin system CcdA family antitoxin [Rhodospirillaceae bacterium]